MANRWMWAAFSMGAALAGCSGGAEGGDCTALVDGTWTFGGEAMAMDMVAAVTMDVEGCTFAITDWTMTMGSVPTGGTVAGDQVTLAGDDAYWATCTGTVAEDGRSADGACDDGYFFSMAAN